MKLIACYLSLIFIQLSTLGNCLAKEQPPAAPSVLVNAYAQSIQDLADQLTLCRKQEAPLNKQQLQQIKELNISRARLRTLLSYQFAQLSYQCSEKQYLNYLMLSQAITKFTHDQSLNLIDKMEKLVSGNERSRWQAKQRYMQLPDSLRERIAQQKIFHSPFSIDEKLDALLFE